MANVGQIETCAVGRYLTILENPLPSIQPSTPSSKHIDVKNSPSLHNSVSQKLDELDLDDKIPKYETTDNCNFSVTNLDSPTSSHCLHYSPSIPLPSSASSSISMGLSTWHWGLWQECINILLYEFLLVWTLPFVFWFFKSSKFSVF